MWVLNFNPNKVLNEIVILLFLKLFSGHRSRDVSHLIHDSVSVHDVLPAKRRFRFFQTFGKLFRHPHRGRRHGQHVQGLLVHHG